MANTSHQFPFTTGSSVSLSAETKNIGGQLMKPGESWDYLIQRALTAMAELYGIDLMTPQELQMAQERQAEQRAERLRKFLKLAEDEQES